MARVIKRKGPPYALIVFVFLFLVATTIMVLQMMRADEAEKKVEELQSTLNALASPQERENPEIISMIREYNQARQRGGQEARTVVEQMDNNISELTKLILGVPTSTQEAITSVEEQVYAQLEAKRALIEQIKLLQQRIEGNKEELRNREARLAELRSQVETLEKSRNELAEKMEAALAEKTEQIQKLTRQSEKYRKSLEDQLAQAKQEWEQKAAELNDTIASKESRIKALEMEVQKWENKHNKLAREIKRELGDRPSLENQPDAKIVNVVQEANICYISKGRGERIRPGLPFNVYPAGPIPEDGKGKAKIVVKNVGAHSSECKIIEQEEDNPIIAGDVVGNVVFDSNRTYSFVVEGVFDLTGRGRPTEAGTETVKMLIERYGGNVKDEIGVQTDFLVMGAEPTRPPEPDETAAAQVWDAYHKQLKVWQNYQDVKARAREMAIPVLNTNRFLAFIGYVPEES